jgi:hypothetical protein
VDEKMTEVEESGKKEGIKTEDEKTTLKDVGNGLFLLAALILISYFILLLVTGTVEVEPGQMVWTLPGYLASTIAIAIILVILGLVLRKISTMREQS